MEKKVQFKLHKVKKQWVSIAVSTLALASLTLGVSQVSGEEITTAPNTPATETLTNEAEPEKVTETVAAETRAETSPTSSTANSDSSNKQTEEILDSRADTRTAVTEDTQPAVQAKPQASDTEHPLSQQELPTTGGRFISDQEGNWSYIKDDTKLTGWQNIDGAELYFDQTGKQIKGDFVQENGQTYFLDPDSGKLWVNRYLDKDGKHYQIDDQGRVTERSSLPNNITGGRFQADAEGNWSYITSQGKKLTGFNYVDGVQLYFDESGKQIKGQEITLNGKTYYLDPDTGAVLKNSFQTVSGPYSFSPKQTVYYNQDGERVIGLFKTNDGSLRYFFKPDGHMAKNTIVSVDDKLYLFDYAGNLVRNSFYGFPTYDIGRPQVNFVFANEKGQLLTGLQTLDGYQLYFDQNGFQAKDQKQEVNGKYYFFDRDNGHIVKNQWVKWSVGLGKWAPLIRDYSAYAGADGALLTGPQTIDGQLHYFADDGTKAENGIFSIKGVDYLFNDKGELVKNGSYAVSTRSWFTTSYKTYYADEQGRVIKN